MTPSSDKDFYIYQNKKFINLDRLNTAGQFLGAIIRDLVVSDEDRAEFMEIESIYVTSQDRTKRNSIHQKGYAIDFVVFPYGMNLWFIEKLSHYKYTAYISTYNHHIHFDLRNQGINSFGAEVLLKNGGYYFPPVNEAFTADDGEITVVRLTKFVEYLIGYYQLHKLENNKLKIISRITNPYTGVRKAISDVTEKGKQVVINIWDNTKIILLIAGIAGLGILLNKNKQEKIYYVEKEN